MGGSEVGCAYPSGAAVSRAFLLASHTVPALTTLRMATADIVAEGVRLAIEFAREPAESRTAGVTVMAATLIVRQSTAPPAA